MATEETKPVERDINVEAEEFLLTNYANIRGKWKWLVPILGAFGQASAAAALERAAQAADKQLKYFGIGDLVRVAVGDAIRALKGRE